MTKLSQEAAAPTFNMLEAKTNLSRLVESIESGAEAEIVIARNGKPAARLLPIAMPAPPRPLGLLNGTYPSMTPEEFDAGNDIIAEMFNGKPDDPI